MSNMDNWYFSFGPSLRFCIQQFPLRLLFVSTFKVGDNGNGTSISWYDDDDDVLTNDSQWTNFWKSWHFVLSFNLTNK
mgnify:FL=1